jgi:hypothetical protein
MWRQAKRGRSGRTRWQANTLLQTCRIGYDAECAVENAVATVGHEGLAGWRPAQRRARAKLLQCGAGRLNPERDDLHRDRRARPELIDQLEPSTMIMSRRLATATIFSRSSAPSSPLIRLSVPRSTSSAPSVVRSIRRCSAKDVSGIPAAAAWAAVPSDVGMSRKRRPSR